MSSISNKIEKRGAELALKSILEAYNDKSQLRAIVPDILDQPCLHLAQCLALFNNAAAVSAHDNTTTTNELSQIEALNLDANISKYQ